MSDAIALAEPDPGWPDAYRVARDEILACLPIVPMMIEHIGSTAVPGLPAKPVIDIIVLLDDITAGRSAIPPLEALGYEYRPDVSGPTRLFLRRRHAGTDQRSHHLHIHGDAGEVRRHLLFRDALRADQTLRDQYTALKEDLARRFPDDRQAYATGKTDFVDRVVSAMGGPPRQPFWTS